MADSNPMDDSYEIDACVRGYHIYQNIWSAIVGQVLPCSQQSNNRSDPYAVAIKSADTVVRRLISAACFPFLSNGGTISCTITGSRGYSHDLVQGGLEVPCILTFTGGKANVDKLKKLIGLVSLPWTTNLKKPTISNSCESPKDGDCSSEIWVRHEKFVLTLSNKDDIVSGRWLSDEHVNFSQIILKEQFPDLHGLESTLVVASKPALVPNKSNYLQIIHCTNNHWITVSTIGCNQAVSGNTVSVYDSLYTTVDVKTVNLLQVVFGKDVHVKTEKCPRQKGSNDCGVFAIAMCVALSIGEVPERFNQERMRSDLLECLDDKIFSLFPTA